MSSRNRNPYPLPQQLLRASAKGELQRVISLISEGATLAVNKHGRTPLHIAAHRGYLDIVRVLLQAGCSPDYQDDNGDTPLQRAVSAGHILVIQRLLDEACLVDRPNNLGDTALHEASRCGQSNIVKLLTNSNCNVDCANKNGDTALHFSCANGHPTCTRLLLSSTSNFSLHNKQGDTPLHLATRYGHSSCVKILIGMGCPLNAQNQIGNTALHVAVVCQSTNICRILVDAGADCNKVKNKKKKTALDLAKELDTGEFALMLISGPRPRSSKRRGRKTERSKQEIPRSHSEPRESIPPTLNDAAVRKEKSSFKRLLSKRKKARKQSSPSPTRRQQSVSTPATPKLSRPAQTLDDYYKKLHVNPYVVPQLYALHRDNDGRVDQVPILERLPNPTPQIVNQLNRSIEEARLELHNSVEQSNNVLMQRIQELKDQTEFQLKSLNRLTKERMNAERTMCLHRIDQRAMYERMVSEQSLRERLNNWAEMRLDHSDPPTHATGSYTVKPCSFVPISTADPMHSEDTPGPSGYNPGQFDSHIAFASISREMESRSIDSGVGTSIGIKDRLTGSSPNGTSSQSSPRVDKVAQTSSHSLMYQRRLLTYTPPDSLSSDQSWYKAHAQTSDTKQTFSKSIPSNLHKFVATQSWHGVPSHNGFPMFNGSQEDHVNEEADLLNELKQQSSVFDSDYYYRESQISKLKDGNGFGVTPYQFQEEDIDIIDQLRDYTLSQTHAV